MRCLNENGKKATDEQDEEKKTKRNENKYNIMQMQNHMNW